MFVLITSIFGSKSDNARIMRSNQIGIAIGTIIKDFLDFTPDLTDSYVGI